MTGFVFVISQYWYLGVAAFVLGVFAGWLAASRGPEQGGSAHG